jgi:hypothetical protein
VDLSAAPIRSLIDLMVRKHTVMDPTLCVTESLYVPENGDLSPAYAPFEGTLPPTTERGFREGGYAVPKDLHAHRFQEEPSQVDRDWWRQCTRPASLSLPGRMAPVWKLVRELEIYVDAGMTASEALASATIVAARNVGVDKLTGSIDVGKAADLLLVDGDPSVRIGDLRNNPGGDAGRKASGRRRAKSRRGLFGSAEETLSDARLERASRSMP